MPARIGWEVACASHLGRDSAGPSSVVEAAGNAKFSTNYPPLRDLEEIADHLAVSVNTVKSQARAIYGKLGVSSRRTAVLAAHEQGLLR